MSDSIETRNMALADAVADITEYVTSRLAALHDATGKTVDFHLIAVDGEDFELCSHITDHDRMADAFSDQVCRWVDQGLCSFDDDETEDPLFTATFDPQKVRPS